VGIGEADLAKQLESLEAQEADLQERLGEVRGAKKMARHLLGLLMKQKMDAARQAKEQAEQQQEPVG
jgi:hypothetical protein